MTEQKRYTAQEMRQTAGMDFHATKLGLDDRTDLTDEIRSMLRQAADSEEELAELRDQVNRDFGESVSLKARLEAVVKECEKLTHGCECVNAYLDVHFVRSHSDAILRAARGEGGVE